MGNVKYPISIEMINNACKSKQAGPLNCNCHQGCNVNFEDFGILIKECYVKEHSN